MKNKSIRTQTRKNTPELATVITPAAAVTSALLAPAAFAATGDLDPGFGDIGRLGPILNAPAWSMRVQDDDSILLAGGGIEYDYYYYPVVSNFVSQIPGSGSAGPDFISASLANIEVFDVARLSDGRLIAVGRVAFAGRGGLAVFRLESNGALETTFGIDGVLSIYLSDSGKLHMATSIVLDPDDRMVIAGVADGQLVVLRLLPDGSFDNSFGDLGVFTTPDVIPVQPYAPGFLATIVHGADNGYRVSTSTSSGCQVLALTSAGQLDDTFGTSGIATLDVSTAEPPYCNTMVPEDGGSLLLAGTAAEHGFVVRLLADGTPDATLSTAAVWDAMENATAVAPAANGTIAVAGTGISGASIMRLQANGDLDALFGNGGSTLLDLQSEFSHQTEVHEMAVTTDGSVVAAGGVGYEAFIVKLLGDSGGASPGVLSIADGPEVTTSERSDYAVVNVRRTGGSDGAVSVAFRTDVLLDSWPPPAVSGYDFSAVSGRLTWLDGDTTEQQIQVPIVSDSVTEDYEQFIVKLEDPQGGAGLGTYTVPVVIEADGRPSGVFSFGTFDFRQPAVSAVEGGWATLGVCREYYSSGAVSVTATAVGQTATAGIDFNFSPIVLSWADLDSGCKSIVIPIVDDKEREPLEEFRIYLSDPTGGAVVGSESGARVVILASDDKVKDHGGTLDLLSLLLLSIGGLMRWTARAWARSVNPSLTD